MQTTHNYRKHTHKNPIQRWLLEQFYKALLSQINTLNPQKILDVGCGEGFTLNKLQQVGIGEKLEGIEFDQTAIDLGKHMYPGIKIIKGSIYELPYEKNAFDVVICTEVLEHLENPKQALQELARVTKKYCIVTVPNEPFFMIGNFMRGKNIRRFGNDIEHINHWSAFGFRKLVNQYFVIREFKILSFWTLIIGEKRI